MHADQEPARGRSIDWPARLNHPGRRALALLERISLAFEGLVEKWVRKPVFNPFYHTGTITNFLLLLILATGVYLTLFYQFGFDASYRAVSGIEANLVGRWMRAIHKYASGAALLTSLLHGWRMLFMDRFRGPRWLAWVTGVGLTVLVWVAGASGYWMIWDERAALLNHTLILLVEDTRLGAAFLLNTLVGEAAGTGWVFMVIVITLHLGASALIGVSLWYHLKRLSRPKWLPPAYWMWIIAGLLTLAGLALPLGILPQADPGRLPVDLPVDGWFLFHLPAALSTRALAFWSSALLLIGLTSLVPWFQRRKPAEPVRVDPDRCTGCTLCEADCPYTAIRMIEAPVDSRHQYLAEIDPALCVACGVCIGSCPPLALSLGDLPPEPLWEETVRRAKQAAADGRPLVFTCERHAVQGARKLLKEGQETVIPLTCIGMAHPDLAAWALDAGAPEVRFIGCPPEDCANREGNVWMAERLAGARKPKLRLAYRDKRVAGAWLPPNAFQAALKPSEGRSASRATMYGMEPRSVPWKAFVPGLFLFILVLAGQIWLSNLPFEPAASEQAYVELAFQHRRGTELETSGVSLPGGVTEGLAVQLMIGDHNILSVIYPDAPEYDVFTRIPLQPARHPLRLSLSEGGRTWVLFDEPVVLAPGEIFAISPQDTVTGGDPDAGEQLYYETDLGNNAGCRICHSLEPGVVLVGPSFAGVATRAETRVPGLSAEAYLRQSILEPNAYIVEGFPANQMPPNLGESLTEQQINDLIAFLLTMP